MAHFLINNLFGIFTTTLNFVSPSILADILLHPFDFATVLLQIGFDPEGIKNESATLVSVILQYALLTFYIPYLLTSIHGLQFIGMPHPSIFYYVNYIYNQEGFTGCYRGLLLKIWERLIMVGVNEKVKKSIHKDFSRSSSQGENESDEDKFTESLINDICSQFFAVLFSHPLHVLMVASFAEFTCDKKSSISQLFRSVYRDDGCVGFFTGLTARLLGEILSLIFSATYTAIINKQTRPQQETVKLSQVSSSQKNVNHIVNYVTNMSRFTALKPSECEENESADTFSCEELLEAELPENETTGSTHAFNRLETITQPYNTFERNSRTSPEIRSERPFAFLHFAPITSKLFYYIMIRDYLSKKISNPFFLVCHCAIILGTGWDKFPVAVYLHSLFELSPPKPTLETSTNFAERKKPLPKIT